MSALRRRSSGLVALALLLAGAPVQGQSVHSSGGFTSLSDGGLIAGPGYGQYGNVAGFAPVGSVGGYLWLEGVFGERPGSQGNYFDIGTFLPGPACWGGMTFADVQVFGDEAARVGVDTNLGWRTLLGAGTMLGIYGSYTHDHSVNEYAYDWAGGGAQIALSHLQLDGNVYLPLGNEQHAIGPRILTDNITLSGRTVGFLDWQLVEQNMRGADLNLTGWVPGNEWLYGGVGIYRFSAEDGEDTSGYRVRGGLDFNSTQVNVSVANDNLFGTTTDVSVAWVIGRDGNYGTPRGIDRRLYDRVIKQRRIATTTFLADVFTPAGDGRGGTLDIAYVNNENFGFGDGTLEDPFTQLDFANGEDVDIIAVMRGTTDAANKLQAGSGLVLAPFQRLIGEGREHVIEIPGRGTFLVPGLETTGPNPFVTADPGATIVTLAGNTHVNGLNLMPDVGGLAIGGNNVNNFTIRNINLDVPPGMDTGPGAGIRLTNARGIGVVENVIFDVQDPTAAGGLRIENANMSQFNLRVNNAILEGGQVGLGLFANNSEINAALSNVAAEENGVGLLLRSFGTSELNVGVSDSSFLNAQVGPDAGRNIALRADAGLTNLTLNRVLATGADIHGFNAVLSNDARLNLGAADTDFSGAGVDGINLSANDSDVRANFLRTAGNDTGRDGLNILADNTGDVQVLVDSSSFQGVGRDAHHVEALNVSTVDLMLSGTPSVQAGRHGLFFNVGNGSQFDAMLQNANLSTAPDAAGSHAVFGVLGGGSVVDLALINSHASTAGGNGMLVTARGGSQFDSTVTDSAFTGAAANAFEINLDNSVGSLLLDGVSAGAATGSALVVNAANASVFTGSAIDSNLSAAGDDGVRLGFDGSNGTLSLSNTPVVNAGGNAYDLGLTNNSAVGVTVTGSASYGAGGNALAFNGDASSRLTASFTDSSLSTNANPAGRGGILGTLDNGATATLNLLRSDVSRPGMNVLDDALMVSADNGSAFVGNITNSMFTDAAGSAFIFFLDNGSSGLLNLNNASGSRAGADGVSVTAAGNSTFNANLTNGTVFNNVGGSPLRLVSNSGSTVNVVGTGVSGANAGSDAIALSAAGGTIGLNLQGPGFFDNAGGGGLSADLSGSANLLAVLNGVTLTNAATTGVRVNAAGSIFDVRLIGSGVGNAGSDAFDLDLNNSQGTLLVDNTGAANSGGTALEVDALNGSTLGVQLLNGVSLDNAAVDGISINADASTVTVNGPGASGANAGDDAVAFDAANGSNVQITLGGTLLAPKFFSGAGGDGVVGTLSGGSSAIVNLTDAILTGPGADAFSITATDSTFGGTLLRTGLSGAGGNAVNLIFSNSTGALALTESPMDNAGADGLHVEATAASILDIDIVDGSVTGAGDDAYDVDFSGGSMVDLFVDPTPSSGAGDHGLEFVGGTASTLNATFIDSDLSTAGDAAGGEGVLGSLLGGSVAVLNLTRSDIAGAGGSAVDVAASAGSSFTANVSDSSLAGAGGNGAVLLLDQSTGALNFTTVDISNAALDGVRVRGQNSSTLTGGFTDVTLADAGGNGLLLDMNASSGQLSLTNVNLNDAGLDALGLLAASSSTITATGNNVSGARAGMAGIDVESSQLSDVTLTLANTGSFAMAGGSGLEITADNARAVATISGLPSFNGSNTGVSIDAVNNAFVAALLTDVTMTGVTTDAARVNATDSRVNVVVTNGDLSSAGDNGVELNYANSIGVVNLANSAVDNATVDAFHVTTTALTDLKLKLTSVSAAGAGDDTFDLTGVGPATLVLDIDPNDLTGAGDNTFEFNFSQGAALNVSVADSPMSTGMTPVGNNVILGVLNSGATASFNVVNSQMTDAANDAVNIVADGMGTAFLATFDANSDMDGAGDNALDLTATNGAVIGIGADGVSFNNAGGSAIVGSFDNAAGMFNIRNFSANGSGNIGLELTADTDALITGAFNNGSFDGNAVQGMKLTTNPDMSLNDMALIDLDFNMVTENAVMAVNALAAGDESTPARPQTAGIVIDFASGTIQFDGEGLIDDETPDGVDAAADTDKGGP